MTRRPPLITGVLPTGEGGLEVHWAVDTFFPDSAEPERVLVDLNGALFAQLGPDEDSIEVPPDTLAALAPLVTVSGSFWWAGSPAEEQQSSVQVPVHGGAGSGAAGVLPALKPIVTIVGVQPRTAAAPASITLRWETNNHNDGNIFWGPATAPRSQVRSIRPANASVTNGLFTATVAPNTLHSFTVEVRNTLHSPTWLATTVLVRSAGDRTPTTSVRQYLQQTGRPTTTSLASLLGPSRSLRALILG